CRNRLGYDRGLEAVARDPAFDGEWRDWILKVRHQIGMVDLADLIYVHSEYYWQRQRTPVSAPFKRAEGPPRRDAVQSASAAGVPDETDSPSPEQTALVLFGEREGR